MDPSSSPTHGIALNTARLRAGRRHLRHLGATIHRNTQHRKQLFQIHRLHHQAGGSGTTVFGAACFCESWPRGVADGGAQRVDGQYSMRYHGSAMTTDPSMGPPKDQPGTDRVKILLV